MIAPIREIDPPSEASSRKSNEVRQLLASLFLEETKQTTSPAPLVSRWKAWLLVTWAAGVTLAYLAAMLDLI